jgi:hypothetical protein
MTIRFLGWRNDSLCFALLPLVCLALVGPTETCAQGSTGEPKGQFLYLLDCGATLHKFDATAEKLIDNTNLGVITRLVPTHGDVAGSAVDGCAANGATYSLRDAIFMTLAPTTGSVDENGKQRYLLLRFHLPDLKLVDSIPVPGAYESAPKLVGSAMGTTQVITNAGTFSLADNKLTPGHEEDQPSIPGSRPVTAGGSMLQMDVGGYDLSKLKLNPQPTHLVYTALERSGNIVLIEVIRPGQDFAFAVVDTAAKEITELNPGFKSTADNFHLTPGGQAVLAAEAVYSQGMQVAQTTGKLALIDSKKGAVVRAWSDLRAIHSSLIAITPTGAAVFFSNDQYHFVPTGSRFPDQPIYRLRNEQSSWYFYADR